MAIEGYPACTQSGELSCVPLTMHVLGCSSASLLTITHSSHPPPTLTLAAFKHKFEHVLEADQRCADHLETIRGMVVHVRTLNARLHFVDVIPIWGDDSGDHSPDDSEQQHQQKQPHSEKLQLLCDQKDYDGNLPNMIKGLRFGNVVLVEGFPGECVCARACVCVSVNGSHI